MSQAQNLKLHKYWVSIVLVGTSIIFFWLYNFHKEYAVQLSNDVMIEDVFYEDNKKVLGSKDEHESYPAKKLEESDYSDTVARQTTAFQSNNNLVQKANNLQIVFNTDGFIPREIKVTVGKTVTFINQTQSPLWINSNYYLEKHNENNCEKTKFNSCAQINSSESYTIKLSEPGEWIYFDQFSQKKGKIIVESD